MPKVTRRGRSSLNIESIKTSGRTRRGKIDKMFSPYQSRRSACTVAVKAYREMVSQEDRDIDKTVASLQRYLVVDK